ncbi:hypothetical protein PENSOL_c049G11922, partial [Penicillium solitum]
LTSLIIILGILTIADWFRYIS